MEKRNESDKRYWIVGIHPVLAALNNPNRKKYHLYLTKEVKKKFSPNIMTNLLVSTNNLKITECPSTYLARSQLDKLVGNNFHQGIALLAYPLENTTLDSFLKLNFNKRSIVIILDQLTDPQNIGAIIRSAKAFSVSAIICLEKNTPKENTLITKSSAGAIEKIKIIYVKNLVNTIKKLKEFNYWSMAMDKDSKLTLNDFSKNTSLSNENLAIVLGNEGKGIRPLVKKNCDTSVRIDISKDTNSLNVSATLAIVLYAINQT